MVKQQFCNDVGIFHEGLAEAEDETGWFHIKEDGNPAYHQRYKLVEYFQKGLAWAQRIDDVWVRINIHGCVIKTNKTSFVI